MWLYQKKLKCNAHAYRSVVQLHLNHIQKVKHVQYNEWNIESYRERKREREQATDLCAKKKSNNKQVELIKLYKMLLH